MKMARSMQKARKFPNDFWANVVARSIYILRRSPTNSVKGKVPQEEKSGTKSSV